MITRSSSFLNVRLSSSPHFPNFQSPLELSGVHVGGGVCVCENVALRWTINLQQCCTLTPNPSLFLFMNTHCSFLPLPSFLRSLHSNLSQQRCHGYLFTTVSLFVQLYPTNSRPPSLAPYTHSYRSGLNRSVSDMDARSHDEARRRFRAPRSSLQRSGRYTTSISPNTRKKKKQVQRSE